MSLAMECYECYPSAMKVDYTHTHSERNAETDSATGQEKRSTTAIFTMAVSEKEALNRERERDGGCCAIDRSKKDISSSYFVFFEICVCKGI